MVAQKGLSLYVAVVIGLLLVVGQAEAQIENCKGTANKYPPVASNGTFIKSVTNGKLYMDYTVNPPMRIVHAWGSAFEMGVAIGQLLASDLRVFLPKVMTFFEGQAADSLPKGTPKWIIELVEQYGVPFALDMTYQMTKPFTPAHFEEELKGMAQGSGVDITLFRRLNMIPELIKASCSMVGAWGPAIAQVGKENSSNLNYPKKTQTSPKHSQSTWKQTANEYASTEQATNGKKNTAFKMNSSSYTTKPTTSSSGTPTLYQLRALDWDTDGPFNDYPAVMVYHPANGVPFATLGWTGFVGALTGYSSSNVGICEKYWGGYNGTYFDEGYPFHYLLRDILQFDPDISAAMNRIYGAQRTCAIFVGLGDSDTHQFRAVEYSHSTVNMYSDVSYPRYPGHPAAPGLVYVDKHFQPSHDPCLGSVLLANYGHLDSDHLILAASLHKTGDNHAAVYDYANNYMYVSSASSASTPPVIPAYDRQFLRLDLNQLWAETRP